MAREPRPSRPQRSAQPKPASGPPPADEPLSLPPASSDDPGNTVALNEEDELSLQVEAAPRKKVEDEPVYHGPRRPVQAVDGRPTQLDTSNLIPIAGLAAVVIIVVGCYFAFKPAPPPKPPAQREAQESPAAQSESPGAQSKPAAVKPSTSGAKATKPTPASKTAASVNTSNPSNREAFHNYMRWIAWAYRDGLNLNEEVLTPKFRETVTLRGVDDPQMLDLHAKMLQNLKIYPLAPLVPTGTLDFGPGGVTKGHEDDPKTRREKLNLAVAMRRLVTTLKERYGVPVIDNPAEPEKTAAPAVPEDPAEAKTVIPPNAPDGEEEEK